MTRTPGTARLHVRTDRMAAKILRLFTWTMFGLFVGTVISIMLAGP